MNHVGSAQGSARSVLIMWSEMCISHSELGLDFSKMVTEMSYSTHINFVRISETQFIRLKKTRLYGRLGHFFFQE